MSNDHTKFVERLGGKLVVPGLEQWQASDRRCFDLIDPASEAVWAVLPMANTADIDHVVQSGKACALAMRSGTLSIPPLNILERLIDEIICRREAFALAIAREMGAPLDFARSKQVDAAVAHLRVILSAGRADRASHQNGHTGSGHAVDHDPYGLAVLITPWNWPLNQVALKVGAALAAGCAMILKPSEHGALSAMLFAECMQAAGAPEGLFSVVLGDGTTGAELVSRPEVDIISFTGSTSVGREIAAVAGGNLTPVLLELGGKSANILFEDCVVETAVQQGVAHCFRNAGQSCNAATRMLVARSIYDNVIAAAKLEAETYIFDDPMRSGAHQGPLVNQAQWHHVQHCISIANQEGARLVTGGKGRCGPHQIGYYPRPTVFVDVTPDMHVFRNEVFGPVLTITPFDTEAEAIALANDSAYGLAAYIQTEDPARAARVARLLDVGMVQINGQSRADGAPFGGRKKSGFGREAGLWGIRAFQSVKSVSGL
ncbi:MAG: aldehyde dehydrogenase family protein [Pseudoruegeria sp.]